MCIRDRWYDEVDKAGFLTFGRVARSIQTHYLNIINFFEKMCIRDSDEGVVRDTFPLTEEIESVEWMPGVIVLQMCIRDRLYSDSAFVSNALPFQR